MKIIMALVILVTALGSQGQTSTTTKENTATTETTATTADIKEIPNGGKEINGFNVYLNAKAESKTSDGGVQFNIETVGTTEDIGTAIGEEGEAYIGKKAVIVDVALKNMGNKDYNAYPDQGTIVLSTGEQVDADMTLSEDVGGELYKGGSKKGTVVFLLNDTDDVKKITSINYIFSVHDDGNFYEHLQTKVKFQ